MKIEKRETTSNFYLLISETVVKIISSKIVES